MLFRELSEVAQYAVVSAMLGESVDLSEEVIEEVTLYCNNPINWYNPEEEERTTIDERLSKQEHNKDGYKV